MKALGKLFGHRAPAHLEVPPWEEVLANPEERLAAAGYWRDVEAAMRARGTIGPVNFPTVLRLVIAYLVADRASVEVLRSTGERAWNTYLEAARLATELEGELGLLPLSRGRTARR
jgi:hypothetical protein